MTGDKPSKTKTVNTLCGWSLGCYLGCSLPFIAIIVVFLLIDQNVYKSPAVPMVLVSLGYVVLILIRITAYVLMIIARIMDSKNTFALTLMWVYIGMIIATVVMSIASVLFLIFMGIGFMPAFTEFIHHF